MLGRLAITEPSSHRTCLLSSQKQGYVSRAAYKLLEIQKKHKVIKPGEGPIQGNAISSRQQATAPLRLQLSHGSALQQQLAGHVVSVATTGTAVSCVWSQAAICWLFTQSLLAA